MNNSVYLPQWYICNWSLCHLDSWEKQAYHCGMDEKRAGQC